MPKKLTRVLVQNQ